MRGWSKQTPSDTRLVSLVDQSKASYDRAQQRRRVRRRPSIKIGVRQMDSEECAQFRRLLRDDQQPNPRMW